MGGEWYGCCLKEPLGRAVFIGGGGGGGGGGGAEEKNRDSNHPHTHKNF